MPTTHRHLTDTDSYVTRDGSSIRELLHPDNSTVRNQSLAEAVLAPGQTSRAHRHRQSEEIYFITHGTGSMQLGEERLDVSPGEAIVIAPGTEHRITNTGDTALRILCMCSPAYSHEDTELLE